MNGTALRRMAVLVVLTLPCVVHVDGGADVAAQTKQSAKKTDKPTRSAAASDTLPRGVREMIDAIQSAVQSGQISDLDAAVDWNEMKPDLGPQFVANPIAYWKSLSKDGEGREILDILAMLLAGKPAVVPLGKDIENNRLYVWPAFADTPIARLAPSETEALVALTTAESLKAMRERDRYTGWRLVIGADGTWHSFRPD